MHDAVLLLDLDAQAPHKVDAAVVREQWRQPILTQCSESSRALLAPLLDSALPIQDYQPSHATQQVLLLKLRLQQQQLIEFQIGLAQPDPPTFNYYPDFSRGKFGFRLLQPVSLRQDIYRAVGVKPGVRPRILDCNAGLGRDALLFAAAGCAVTSSERHPLLFLALDDALRRCRSSGNKIAPFCAGIDLRFADAADLLAVSSGDNVDSVYLDPMFPSREKTAKVKLEAQVLQAYCHDDEDADQLLTLALQKKFKRVCVKRPLHSPYLGNHKPALQYKGKSTRFDVYLGG